MLLILPSETRGTTVSHIALEGMENVCAALGLFGLVTLTQLAALGHPRQLVRGTVLGTTPRKRGSARLQS